MFYYFPFLLMTCAAAFSSDVTSTQTIQQQLPEFSESSATSSGLTTSLGTETESNMTFTQTVTVTSAQLPTTGSQGSIFSTTGTTSSATELESISDFIPTRTALFTTAFTSVSISFVPPKLPITQFPGLLFPGVSGQPTISQLSQLISPSATMTHTGEITSIDFHPIAPGIPKVIAPTQSLTLQPFVSPAGSIIMPIPSPATTAPAESGSKATPDSMSLSLTSNTSVTIPPGSTRSNITSPTNTTSDADAFSSVSATAASSARISTGITALKYIPACFLINIFIVAM